MVTFPFFFGMMFGDMGHGSLYAFFGLFLIFFNEKLKGGAFNGILFMRYFLFLMGLMSTYCGFIYNEYFALPM